MRNHCENRSWQRNALHQALIFELSTKESGRLQNTVQQGVGIDLSPGGMGLVTGYPLKGGEVVKLLLPVTEGETRVPVYTEVMWSAPSGGEYRAGLRFLI